MKTEKQIALLEVQAGAALFEKLEEMDIIKIDANDIFDFPQEMILQKHQKIYPFLTSGAIEITDKNLEEEDFIIFFHIEPFENHMKIEISVIHFPDELISLVPLWDYKARYEVPYEFETENIKIAQINYVDATTSIYKKQNRNDAIKAHFKEIGVVKDELDILMAIFSKITYLLEHPEEKVINNKPAREYTQNTNNIGTDKPVKKESNSSTQERRTINLNNITITTSNQKAARKLTSRKYERVTESWGVRGHIRRYKSGKEVFIKPFTKGTGKIPTPKTYNIE